MLLFEVIIALLAAISVIAVWFLYRRVEKTQTQLEAWEQSQQSQLQTWETQHEKRITALETRLTAQVQATQQAWQKWEAKDAAHQQALTREYQTAITELKLEYELARLLRIEDTPLKTDALGHSRPAFANWRPAMFYKADLRKQNLSHRYLGQADLREAQLAETTLFMSNLSRANLAGADLSRADLSGVDLSEANLRGAILTGANLIVADLQRADLAGANLLGVRNLSAQQLRSAIHDETTQFDSDLDLTLAGIQKVQKGTGKDSTSEAVQPEALSTMPTSAPTTTSIPPTETPEPVAAPAIAPTSVPTTTSIPPIETPEPVVASAIAPASTVEPTDTPSPPAAMSEPNTAEPLSSPLTPDTTSFIQHLAEPAAPAPSMSEPEPATPASAVEEPTTDPGPEVASEIPDPAATLTTDQPVFESAPATSAASATPMIDTLTPAVATETKQADSSETLEPIAPSVMHSPTLLPDMTPPMQQLAEPAPSSPLTSGDSLLDPEVTDLLVDTPESKPTGGTGTATPRRKGNGKRAAKGN